MKRLLLLLAVVGISPLLNGCLVAESRYLEKAGEADTLTRKVADLQKQQQLLSAENGALKAQVAKFAGTVAGLTSDKETLAADNREMEKVLEGKTDALLDGMTGLRQRIADLETENAHLKEDVATLSKVKEEKARQESKTYEELLEALKPELSHGTVTVSELRGKLTLTMSSVLLFASGTDELQPEGLRVLQKVGGVLRQVKGMWINIGGHADSALPGDAVVGKSPSSWELAEARAVKVTRYLQGEGVAPTLLSAVTYGGYRPPTDNGKDGEKVKNGRIEIMLMPREQ